jgi:hypothetical protein
MEYSILIIGGLVNLLTLVTAFGGGVWYLVRLRDKTREASRLIDERLNKNEAERQKLRDDINMVLEILVDTGHAPALAKGWLVRKSPVKLTAEGREALAPFIQQLRDFYRSCGIAMSDVDLFREVYKRFGREIKEKVCDPQNEPTLSGMALAMTLMREQEPHEPSPPDEPTP